MVLERHEMKGQKLGPMPSRVGKPHPECTRVTERWPENPTAQMAPGPHWDLTATATAGTGRSAEGQLEGAVNWGTQSESGCVTKGRQTTITPERKQYPGPSAFFWVHPQKMLELLRKTISP